MGASIFTPAKSDFKLFFPVVRLSTNQPNIQITGIPQTHKHLLLRLKIRAHSVTENLQIQFNGDTTAANYHSAMTKITNSTFFTSNDAGVLGAGYIGFMPVAADASRFYAIHQIYIDDYTDNLLTHNWQAQGAYNKTIATPESVISSAAGSWVNAQAITSILIKSIASDIAATSEYELYGLGKL